MRSLAEIAARYMTDKGPVGFDGNPGGHGYTTTYEALLADRRHDPLVVLELGVAKGASLLMWSEYFTNATILGADIDLGAVDRSRLLGVEGGGWEQLERHAQIQLFEISQTEHAQLIEVIQANGGVDLLIDDGSHRNEHQQDTFEALFPFLLPGGYYVIEDIHAMQEEPNATGPCFLQRAIEYRLHPKVDELLWLVRTRHTQALIIRKRS